jgi:CRP-like cAMP-binding protein
MLPVVQHAPMTRRPFLAGATPEAEAELRSLGVRRRFPAGATLFIEGDVAHDALLLLDGTVKISVTALDGREVILDVLGEGALVGELSAVDGHARSATATGLSPIEVLAIPCAAFIDLLHRRPALMYELLRSVTDRLRGSVRRQLEYGTGDALGRLCGRLLELAHEYGRPAEGGAISLQLPVSQADLASWTGLSREAVVKALRNLRQLQWIDNQGRQVVILEPARLQARAVN